VENAAAKTIEIKLNITVPDHMNTSGIKTNYSMDHHTTSLILQVVSLSEFK